MHCGENLLEIEKKAAIGLTRHNGKSQLEVSTALSVHLPLNRVIKECIKAVNKELFFS